MPGEFIEVVDVKLSVQQPDSSWVDVGVGRFKVVEAGRKEINVLTASIPDFDGSLQNTIRARRNIRLEALAAGEVDYRVVFTGNISTVRASPFEADMLDVTAHDAWKLLKGHRVTLRRFNIDAADAIALILEGSPVTGNNVTTPYGEELDLLHLDYETAQQAIYDLMDRVDADAYIDDDGDLHFFPRGTDTSGLSVTNDGEDTSRPKFEESDAQLANRIRGFGGNGYSEFYTQLVQAATKTVTNAVVIAKRITFPRPELARLILKVERVAGATDYLEVAIQNDNAGVRSGVDVAKAVVPWDQQPEALSEIVIDFPEHIIADTQPWLVIRASGATGVKVGVLSGGDDSPYAKASYKFPVIVEASDADSVAEYGYIDAEIKNPQVTTRAEMLAICKAELARRKVPQRTASIRPMDPAWLDAPRGSTVQVSAPILGIVNEAWTIARKTSTFNGGDVWLLDVDLAAVVQQQDFAALVKDQDDRIRRLERAQVPTQNEDVTKYISATVQRANGSDAGTLAQATSLVGTDRANATDAGSLTAAAAYTWSARKWGLFQWGSA